MREPLQFSHGKGKILGVMGPEIILDLDMRELLLCDCFVDERKSVRARGHRFGKFEMQPSGVAASRLERLGQLTSYTRRVIEKGEVKKKKEKILITTIQQSGTPRMKRWKGRMHGRGLDRDWTMPLKPQMSNSNTKESAWT